MTLVERLSLKLTDEQRERFLQLVAANPEYPVQLLYIRVKNQQEQ